MIVVSFVATFIFLNILIFEMFTPKLEGQPLILFVTFVICTFFSKVTGMYSISQLPMTTVN